MLSFAESFVFSNGLAEKFSLEMEKLYFRAPFPVQQKGQ